MLIRQTIRARSDCVDQRFEPRSFFSLISLSRCWLAGSGVSESVNAQKVTIGAAKIATAIRRRQTHGQTNASADLLAMLCSVEAIESHTGNRQFLARAFAIGRALLYTPPIWSHT